MLIRLHGILARDFGPEYRIEANTPAEAIEGLGSQLHWYEDRPLELRPVVRVVGFDDPRTLYEKTEQEEIHIVPAMIGGSGVGRIVVGGLLIAAAFIIPGVGAVLGGALMSTMLSVGATLVLSGVMQLFMKSPTIERSADPENSKYFGLQDNTVAIGTPIALQWGRGPAQGHVMAVNVDAKDLVFGNFPASPT